MENFEPIIKNQLKTLPPSVRSFIAREQWVTDLDLITGQYNLNHEQADDLFMETLFVLANMEPSQDYIDNISQKVSLPLDVSIQIAKEVAEKIFSQLQKSIDQNKNEPKPQSPVNQSAPREIKTFTLPADPVGERLEKTVSMPPSNLPTSQGGTPPPPENNQPRYTGGNDPYREPIE